MKKYPTYAKGEVEKVYQILPEAEQEVIQEYLNYRRIGSRSERKIADYKRFVVQLLDVTGKNSNKITLKGLRDFLMALNQSGREVKGMNDVKSTIKNFLRWKYKDWSVRFDELRDLKVNVKAKFNSKKINSKTIPTKEEIEKLIDEEPSLFWKTYFITLFESGCRTQEIRDLKWKDIEFDVDEDLTELNIYSTKTEQSRVSYVQKATSYLKTLKEVNKKSDYVFISKITKDKPIRKEAVSEHLKRLSLKVLGRAITPYSIRHARATELYKLARENKISKDSAQTILGHGGDMSKVYEHLTKEEVKEILSKQVYNIKKISPQRKHKLEDEIADLKERYFKSLVQTLKDQRREIDTMKNQLDLLSGGMKNAVPQT